jgi:hypothetical protein
MPQLKVADTHEGLTGPFVELFDGELQVPRAFTAEIEDDGMTATLDIEMDGDRPRVRRLEVRANDVSQEMLRRIPVARIALNALALKAAKPIEFGDLPDHMQVALNEQGLSDRTTLIELADQERHQYYQQLARGARRPRRGSPVGDEHLERVAKLYRAAVERGDPPTETVGKEMHAARSTAARWVALARKRGLLGAAIPGRGGEAA